MPRYGAHAFLWIADWNLTAGNQCIDDCARTGFDFLEIPMLRPDDFDAAAHRKALADAGIDAVVSLTLPRSAHMPAEPERARKFLSGAMDKMETLGCTYLTGCLGYALGILTGQPPTDAERQIVAETLAKVADEAKRRGITLALEPCNRYETYILNTLGDAAALIKLIGADNVFIHGDTYHMNIEEEGFHDPIVAVGGLLGYIHMSESHRGLVGSGNVHWDDAFQGLKDSGYSGPLVLESFAAINEDLRAATCLWRAPNQGPAVLSSQGLKFLKEHAERVGL